METASGAVPRNKNQLPQTRTLLVAWLGTLAGGQILLDRVRQLAQVQVPFRSNCLEGLPRRASDVWDAAQKVARYLAVQVQQLAHLHPGNLIRFQCRRVAHWFQADRRRSREAEDPVFAGLRSLTRPPIGRC